MYLRNIRANTKTQVEIHPVVRSDLKVITKEKFHFDWKQEIGFKLYKLILKDSEEIVGVISFDVMREEWRHHIRLLSISKENVGKDKKFEDIAGHLLAFVARESVREFGKFACISLVPKTKLTKHYISKYNMMQTGITLSLMVPELLDLIERYKSDE